MSVVVSAHHDSIAPVRLHQETLAALHAQTCWDEHEGERKARRVAASRAVFAAVTSDMQARMASAVGA